MCGLVFAIFGANVYLGILRGIIIEASDENLSDEFVLESIFKIKTQPLPQILKFPKEQVVCFLYSVMIDIRAKYGKH